MCKLSCLKRSVVPSLAVLLQAHPGKQQYQSAGKGGFDQVLMGDVVSQLKPRH